MSLCIICHTHDATIPDRDSGSSRKRLCSGCHALRLKGDLRNILRLHKERVGDANNQHDDSGSDAG
jgi:hypothetical protein